MQSGFAAHRGPTLMKTPSHRQQATRRRLAIVCAILGLALASGVVGTMVHPARHVSSQPATGPFSYFPSE